MVTSDVVGVHIYIYINPLKNKLSKHGFVGFNVLGLASLSK